MNNLTRKLIHDGSERKQIRMNLISMSIGFGLLFIGVVCVIIKALSEVNSGSNGQYHEAFFWLPISAAFLFCGFVVFVVIGIRNTIAMLRNQNKVVKAESLHVVMTCITVILLCISAVMFLIEANSGTHTIPICLVCLIGAIIAYVLSVKLKWEVKNELKKNEKKS